MNGLGTSLAEAQATSEELKAKIEAQRAELREYGEYYEWHFAAGAGSNAEAREPEVKARGSNQPSGRVAEDETEGQADELTQPRPATSPRKLWIHTQKKQTEFNWPAGRNLGTSECGA